MKAGSLKVVQAHHVLGSDGKPTETLAIHRDGNLETMEHEVLQVTLKDGTDYVLDLAGAQFGQYRPVLLASSYRVNWTRSYNPEAPFGDHLTQRLTRLGTMQGQEIGLEDDQRIFYVHDMLRTEMDRIIHHHEQSSQTTLSKLIRQDAQYFQTSKSDLIQDLHTKLSAFVEKSELDGTFSFERIGEGPGRKYVLKHPTIFVAGISHGNYPSRPKKSNSPKSSSEVVADETEGAEISSD
jgi:hypothetical protein